MPDTIDDIATRHGFSTEAVRAMAEALRHGGGHMAQFNHPDFGGMGQWSSGGMTMIGEMGNNDLKSRVAALARISRFDRADPGGGGGACGQTSHWWPEQLGTPISSGGRTTCATPAFPINAASR